jgi:hypothetical protein
LACDSLQRFNEITAERMEAERAVMLADEEVRRAVQRGLDLCQTRV